MRALTLRVSWVRPTLLMVDLKRVLPSRVAQKREVEWGLQIAAIYAAIHAALFAYLAWPVQNPKPYCTKLEFLFSVFTPCDHHNLALAFQVWIILTLSFFFLSFAYKVRLIPRIVWNAEIKRCTPALSARTVRRRYYALAAGIWILICSFIFVVGREVPIPYVSALLYLLGAIFFPTLLFCTRGANLNFVLGLLLAVTATAVFLTKIPMLIFLLTALNKTFNIKRALWMLVIVAFAIYGISYFATYRSYITNNGTGDVLNVLLSLEVDPLFILGRLMARIALVDASVFISELINSGYLASGTRPQEAIQLVNGYFALGREVEVVFGYAISLPMLMYLWLGVTGLFLIPVMIRMVDMAVVAVFKQISDNQSLFTLRVIYFLVFMQDSFGKTFQLLIVQLIGFMLVKKIISRRMRNKQARLAQFPQKY